MVVEALLERTKTYSHEIVEPKRSLKFLNPEEVEVGMSVNVRVNQFEPERVRGRIEHHLGGTFFKLVCEQEPPTYRAKLIDVATQKPSSVFA